jgi:hypothetical protein
MEVAVSLALSDLIAPPRPGFAAEADRARLTQASVKAVQRIAAAWQMAGPDAAALLGVSPSTWDRMRAGTWRGTLAQDQLTRASALVGLYKGLHLLFADAMADRWPSLPNRNPLFGGASPIATMIAGGFPEMLETRRLVDAMRGGL